MISVAYSLWKDLLKQPQFVEHSYHCDKCSQFRGYLKGVVSLTDSQVNMIVAHFSAEAQGYSAQIRPAF